MDYSESGVIVHPQAEYVNRQDDPMQKSLRLVLAENVRALKKRHPELGGLRAWSKKIGVGEATLHRIVNAQAGIRLDSIEAVARGFNLPPWMLLIDGLDPANLPVQLSAGERDFYRRLRDAAKQAAEN